MTTMTAGDGNEVTVGTVVIDEKTGDQGIIRGISGPADARVAEVEFPGSQYDYIDAADLNVSAEQDWEPEEH
jgi:hypothetical protein